MTHFYRTISWQAGVIRACAWVLLAIAIALGIG